MTEVNDHSEPDLVAAAAAGDKSALQCLLLRHHDRLIVWLRNRLPEDLRATVSPEDVLQETLIDAVRGISALTVKSPNTFLSWLQAIANHRMLYMLKAHRGAKRGEGRMRGGLKGTRGARRRARLPELQSPYGLLPFRQP